MQMPKADIFDRFSILELKKVRLPNDKLLLQQYEEFESEKEKLLDELNQKDKELAIQYYNELFDINKSIWDIENEIREGGEKHIPLVEIGERALKVRNFNGMRAIAKNKLSTLFDQEYYREVKIDHVSESLFKK